MGRGCARVGRLAGVPPGTGLGLKIALKNRVKKHGDPMMTMMNEELLEELDFTHSTMLQQGAVRDRAPGMNRLFELGDDNVEAWEAAIARQKQGSDGDAGSLDNDDFGDYYDDVSPSAIRTPSHGPSRAISRTVSHHISGATAPGPPAVGPRQE